MASPPHPTARGDTWQVPDVFTVLPVECIAGERLGFYFELYTTLAMPMVVVVMCIATTLLARLLSVGFGYGTGNDADSIFTNADDGIDALLATVYPDGERSDVRMLRMDAFKLSMSVAFKHPRFQNIIIFCMLFLCARRPIVRRRRAPQA